MSEWPSEWPPRKSAVQILWTSRDLLNGRLNGRRDSERYHFFQMSAINPDDLVFRPAEDVACPKCGPDEFCTCAKAVKRGATRAKKRAGAPARSRVPSVAAPVAAPVAASDATEEYPDEYSVTAKTGESFTINWEHGWRMKGDKTTEYGCPLWGLGVPPSQKECRTFNSKEARLRTHVNGKSHRELPQSFLEIWPQAR